MTLATSSTQFLMLAGPDPRSLSLGGPAAPGFPPAPRSSRRRFARRGRRAGSRKYSASRTGRKRKRNVGSVKSTRVRIEYQQFSFVLPCSRVFTRAKKTNESRLEFDYWERTLLADAREQVKLFNTNLARHRSDVDSCRTSRRAA